MKILLIILIMAIVPVAFDLINEVSTPKEVSSKPVLVKPKVSPPVLVKPKISRPVLVKPKISRPVLVKPKIKRKIKKENIAWLNMINGVKTFEGFRAKSYICCGGKKTIGYGHTGSAVHKKIISEIEAAELLEIELEATKEIVLSIVKVPLTDHQLAALTSFTYNCGRGALYQLVAKDGRLNDGNYDSINEIMPLYRMAGGKIRKGLVKRRSFELALWNGEI